MRVLAVVAVLTVALPTPAEAHHKRGPCSIHWRLAYSEGHKAPVRDLIRCAARRWNVDVDTALRVAACESGQRPDADGGAYGGLYQHVRSAWPSRARRWIWRTWEVGHGIYNARAQAIVTMRMVDRFGWDAWGCSG